MALRQAALGLGKRVAELPKGSLASAARGYHERVRVWTPAPNSSPGGSNVGYGSSWGANVFFAFSVAHPQVVEHYENPRNVGSMDKKSENVGTGLVGAPACGDVMKLQIKVDDDGNIEDAKFKTFGCGSAIASSSVATEWIKGQNVDEAATLKNSDIAKHLSLPPVKLHCSMLAEDAIKSAINDVKGKRGEISAGEEQAESHATEEGEKSSVAQ